VVAVVDHAVQHLHHAGGPQEHRDLERPRRCGPRDQLLHRSRGRPGCTRYQCPSNIASLTLPRNTAPTSSRASGEEIRPARELRGREQADRAADGRDQVEGRRELGTAICLVAAVTGAPDHRGDARPPRGAYFLAALYPGRPALHRHRERGPRARDARDRGNRRDHPCGREVAGEEDDHRADSHRREHDPDQPPVAEAHEPAAGRHPAEQQPARGHCSRNVAASSFTQRSRYRAGQRSVAADRCRSPPRCPRAACRTDRGSRSPARR